MFKAVLRARPYDSEEECLDAVLKHKVQKGDAVFIRYEDQKEAECRRCSILQRQSAVIKSLKEYCADYRRPFFGASTGLVIGHCSPGVVDGYLIALVEEGDLIEIDVMERKLNIIGVAGERKSMEEIDQILAERRKTGNR